MPLTDSQTRFDRLFEQAEIAKYSPLNRQKYEESLKTFRDWHSCLVTAERKGRAEGLAEGREEGRAEGRKEEKLNIARILKVGGKYSTAEIMVITQLTEQEVENA